MNPQVNLRPPPTPVSVIKSIIFDKTLQWRVKDGYFELDLRDYLKIHLLLDKKALILYFFTIKDGERWCRLVEIWNIDTFQLRNRTGGELTWLFNHNLDQFGIQILIPDVAVPQIGEFYPHRLAQVATHVGGLAKLYGNPLMLVKIGGEKYLVEWSLEKADFKHTWKYFDRFLSPPIPIEYLDLRAQAYLCCGANRGGYSVHYPVKKKDRGKAKILVHLPPLERVVGSGLAEFHLGERGREEFERVVREGRAVWLDDSPHRGEDFGSDDRCGQR